MNNTRKYKPRTEAQKAARRERDRKRREALRRANRKQQTKVAEKHPIVKTAEEEMREIKIDIVPPKKRLVKVTVIKEYELD